MIFFSKKNHTFYLSTLLCLTSLSTTPINAITKTWSSVFSPFWNSSAVWEPLSPGYPGQTEEGGDIAIFNNRNTTSFVSTLPPANIVLGELRFNIPPPLLTFTLSPQSFTFKSAIAGSPAFINVLSGGLTMRPPVAGLPLTLASNLIVNLADLPRERAGITIAYNIEDSPGTSFSITFNTKPNAGATLSGVNNNSGDYIFNGGITTLSSPGVAIPSTLFVNSGATAFIGNTGVNQFSTSADVILRGGTLNLNSSNVQQFESLTIDSGGLAINSSSGTPSTTLTLNSGTTALEMKGGDFQITNLVLSNGGAIAFNRSLAGSGHAIIGVPSRSTTIDLNGYTVNLAIDDGSTSPHILDDLAFLNTQFTGGGSLNKINAGTLLFEGNNSLPSLTLNGGRVLIGRFGNDVTTLGNSQLIINPRTTLGGFGTLGTGGTTVVTNSGTVEPGSEDQIGTLTLSGSYNQNPNGTLFIKLANRSSDRFVVTGGGVNLDGTLFVEGDNAQFNPGERIVILDNSLGTGIQGTFARLIEDISDNLLTKFIVQPNQVVLEFFTSPEPEIGALESSQVLRLTGHNLNVISRLRAVRNRFETLEWEKTDSLQAQAKPPKKTIALKGRRLQTHDFITVVPEEEMITAGRFWKKPRDQPASIYIAPLGSWGSVDQIEMQEGYDFHSIGGLLGGDYAFDHAGMGALLGYERVHGTIEDHFGNFHSNSLFGQAYGTFLPLKNRNFFLDLIAGGSRNWYTLNRQSNCAIAQGKPNGWEYDGYAGVGYDIHMKKEWRLTPILGIQYMHLQVDDFTEEGARDENLFVCEQKIHSLRSWAGLSFGGKLNRDKVIWMPEVRGYWQHEFAKTSHCVGVSAPCLGLSESLKVFTSDRNYGIVGAELRALFGLKNRWTLAGAYDYYWSGSTHINYLYGELGFNF